LFLPLLLLGAGPGTARADDPPLKNRPARFSGAVGEFEITQTAVPTDLRPDETVTLTVKVAAVGPFREPPQRPDLKGLPAFADRFHVADLPDPAAPKPDARSWEFVYRLRPKDATVDEVPSLPFIYYKPGPGTARGAYQTAYADGIDLHVHEPAPPPKPLPEGPESLYRIAEGHGVLPGRSWGDFFPSAAVFVLIVAPLACAAWYRVWQRLYPDAARQARQRRSQAARLALRALEPLRRRPPPDQARLATAVVTTYLRQRLDLPAAEPTAAEAVAPLKRFGCTDGLTRELVEFYHAGDATRFAPAPPEPVPFADTAARLILALETELCPPPSSPSS
jgi:hypothetical protein